MPKARKRKNRQDVDEKENKVKELPWESFRKNFTESRENIKMELENLKGFKFKLEQIMRTIDSGIEHIEIGLRDISDECMYNK